MVVDAECDTGVREVCIEIFDGWLDRGSIVKEIRYWSAVAGLDGFGPRLHDT